MNETIRPDLATLLGLFPPTDDLASYEYVRGEDVPAPYHDLLVHDHHMTVTVEEFHGSLVDVKVLYKTAAGDSYARKILLALQSTGRVVQYGIVRIHFQHTSAAVREQIVAEGTPLGRVLINNNVLRRIEPTAFLKITPGKDLMKWFGMTEPTTVYGRLAYIHCNEQPAVEVLEIVTPV